VRETGWACLDLTSRTLVYGADEGCGASDSARFAALTLNVRSVISTLVDLLVNQLKLAIRDLLAKKGIRARVLDKTNAQGERVIGIIISRDQRAPPREA
jgi:hypothetical protein